MGVLRFLLASAVILQHTGGFFGQSMVAANASVETFFMISGFYMALVLNEKYLGEGSYSIFIRSRIFRLFPAYLVVLAVTVLLEICIAPNFDFEGNGGYGWMHSIVSFTPLTRIFLAITNTVLLGQDVVMFLAVGPKTGALYFTPDFWTAPIPAWHYLFIPPAWSLSIELMFYAIAPFLVRRNAKTLATLVGLSVALRLYLYVALHLRNDPWTYRFFPTEIAFFLLGALGYKAYKRLQPQKKQLGIWPQVVWGICIALAFLEPHLPHRGSLGRLFFFVCFAIALPLIFLQTKSNKRDRWIGELSYPMYITHYPIMVLCFSRGYHNSFLIFTLTMVVSIVLFKFVDQPIDAWRQKLIQRQESQKHKEPLPSPSTP